MILPSTAFQQQNWNQMVPRPAHTIQFQDYEVYHQTHRSEANSAFRCLTDAVLEDFEPKNFYNAMKR